MNLVGAGESIDHHLLANRTWTLGEVKKTARRFRVRRGVAVTVTRGIRVGDLLEPRERSEEPTSQRLCRDGSLRGCADPGHVRGRPRCCDSFLYTHLSVGYAASMKTTLPQATLGGAGDTTETHYCGVSLRGPVWVL